MSIVSRAVVVAIVVGVLLLPITTGHALLTDLLFHGDGALVHVDFGPLLGLTALSLVPVAGLARGLLHWLAARRRLAALAREGVPVRSEPVDYVRLPGDQVALFTSGLWRPVVYATAGAERTLAPAAFRAAVLHEQGHVRHHHVRWLALLALAEASVGALPGVRGAFRGLRVQAEWQADRAALEWGAERQDLFEAIVGAAGSPVPAAALSGTGTSERLRWLAGAEAPGADPVVAPVLAGLLVTPLAAHALVWTGYVCALCAEQLR